MLRMLYMDEDRLIETCSDKFGVDTYTVGDAARRYEDGYSGSSGALEEKVSERQSEDEE
jgi:acyl-coenzyme A synthetase/AMP-(fatty) acid ligase